jgi:glycosyltransferase involved in cell wall biosynthesis
MADVLLTVSGVIPDDLGGRVHRGERPRADYVAMAAAFDADVIDVRAAREMAGAPGRLIEKVAGAGSLLAWVTFRRRRHYRLVFTDGEQVGLPYAVLTRLVRRRPIHFMIVHIMSVPKKSVLARALRLRSRIDRWFVYSSAQADFLTRQLGVPATDVTLTPFMVDTRFFAPRPHDATGERPTVCAAGLEFRDYPTLIDALADLDVDVVLAAASPWSKRPDTTAGVDLPANVQVGRLDLDELRELYARSSVVAVPLTEVDFQAGITTILEAMAMGKPVVCTRTTGQTDTVVDGVTGRYVPPGDARALRDAVVGLLSDPVGAADMGAAARSWAERHAELDVYADRLAAHVRAALAGDR